MASNTEGALRQYRPYNGAAPARAAKRKLRRAFQARGAPQHAARLGLFTSRHARLPPRPTLCMLPHYRNLTHAKPHKTARPLLWCQWL